MTDLSTEQGAALVAALENGGVFVDDPQDVGMPRSIYYPPRRLNVAGLIVAQLCKQRELDVGSQAARLSQIDELENQQPYWRPIETAPRDGTRILILWRGEEAHIGSADNELGFPGCTHWMPLPNPVSRQRDEALAPESEG